MEMSKFKFPSPNYQIIKEKNVLIYGKYPDNRIPTANLVDPLWERSNIEYL